MKETLKFIHAILGLSSMVMGVAIGVNILLEMMFNRDNNHQAWCEFTCGTGYWFLGCVLTFFAMGYVSITIDS